MCIISLPKKLYFFFIFLKVRFNIHLLTDLLLPFTICRSYETIFCRTTVCWQLLVLIHIHTRKSPRIFEIIRSGPNGILSGGKLILEKNLKLKISCQTPFNMSTISGFGGMAGFETRELVVTNCATNLYY